ncbi:MAG: SIR2 family protein, partial [Bacteroidia bacterium]
MEEEREFGVCLDGILLQNMKPQIALENSLLKALNEGVNLFLGSGFSLLAKDKEGINLPVGDSLLKEIRHAFNEVPDGLDLAKTSTFLEKTDKERFQRFLKERFCVDSFDNKYLNLLKTNIKGIYTTNIDDLCVKIFGSSTSMYLSDVTLKGASFNESKSVDYVPLHGAIYNSERKLIFSTSDISSAFANDRDIWQYLRFAIEKHPTIFWGYSLNDSGVIQTLFSNPTREGFQKSKWIILKEKKDSEIKYFETLGFNVIISDTSSFLEYLSQIKKGAQTDISGSNQISELMDFKGLTIPKAGTGPLRPLSEFFMGAPPIWNDIFSNKIYKTHHYEKVIDLINKNNKNIIVLGTPVSGKTTLLLQIAANYDFKGVKLASNFISIERAEIISKLFSNNKLLLFIDDFRDNLEAFSILSANKNIRMICFEREHNYEVISHKINESTFEFHDITDISKRDIQAIYDSIPADIKKRNLSPTETSLFEFLCENIEKQNVKERFTKVLQELNNQSEDLADLFVMSCYCHYCRIPVSVDMAYAFLSNNIDDYNGIVDIIDQLGKLISDYDYSDPIIDKEQDYFQPRSHIVADTVMNQVPRPILKRVLDRFHHNVPIIRTVNYHVFRKTAFDKDFFSRAYPDWVEGKRFYEFLYSRENDYY